LLQPCTGAVVGIFLGVERGLTDEFLGEQASMAITFGLGRRQVTLRGGQLCAGCGCGQLQVTRIETGQRLAGLDLGSRVDQPGGNLAAHSKGQVDLVAGANFAGVNPGA
jgi:hypothetical protein